MEKEKEKVIYSPGGISYSGAVKIRIKDRVIEKHNTGTVDFFKFILNCIRGNNLPKERPYFLWLYDGNFNNKIVNMGFVLSSDSEPTPVIGEYEYGDDAAVVSFTTLIADSYISGRSFQGIEITNYNGVPYARIKLDDIVEIEGSNTNVVIDWVITLGNAKIKDEV